MIRAKRSRSAGPIMVPERRKYMSTMPLSEVKFDPARSDAFGGYMIDVLNHGALTITISVGHRAGLFDVMAELPPSTSEDIAREAGLHERYVREWLGAMVTGRIVEYDGQTRTYLLPAEHAAMLTRESGTDNMAFYAQYIGLLGGVEEKIAEVFRSGGGIGYEHFPAFQAIQAEETARIYDAKLVDTILPLQRGLIERLRRGIAVADIGCGAGHAINVMGRAFPKSTFTGYDFSAEGIAIARAEARQWELENVRFELRDVAELEAAGYYDLVTAFDAIHDQIKPREVLRRVFRALRSDGLFLMADIAGSSDLEKNLDLPFAPTLYTYSVMHCMTVSLAHGGEGLGTMWGEEKALELLAEAGFSRVEVKTVEGDILNNYYLAQR
jgi:2-polyprenyl-3-methyl-5-hydroxy-6-metoxy-1,4-benzoquinol methylase